MPSLSRPWHSNSMNATANATAREPAHPSAKITELESIRGLAALLIVFYHLPKWHPMLDVGIVNNGHLMVELFFVLSGFVICNAYAGRINQANDLARFQFLRLGRLYPVHLIFLAVFVLIELAKYVAQLKLGISSPNSRPFQDNNWTAFLYNLLLIQSVLPNQPVTFNFPAWSISVEFYTYLVFGAGMLLFRRSILFFSCLALLSLALLSTGLTAGYDNLLRCFSGFFLGCLTDQMAKTATVTLPRFAPWLVLSSILVFLQFKTDARLDAAIYFLTAALIASLTLSSPGLLNRLLQWRPLVWLGTVSYSVYMSHAAVEWVTNQTFRVLLKRPEKVGSNGISDPQLSLPETMVACTVVVAVILLISALVYQFVEKPLREKSRKIAFNQFT